MSIQEKDFLDIRCIGIAHAFTLDAVRRCHYPQGRGWYGLIYGVEGRAIYRFADGERCTVQAGDVLLLPKWAAYRVVTEGAFRHYTVNFDVHGKDTVFEDENYFLLLSAVSGRYAPLFAELTALWGTDMHGSMMAAHGILYRLLGRFFADLAVAKQDTAAHRRLAPAKAYIEQHYTADIAVSHLAALTAMSETHFRREWRRLFGETALQYRDRLRLAQAKACLATGGCTVSETAVVCGFSEIGYFVRFFKKHTGMSPGVYKTANSIL